MQAADNLFAAVGDVGVAAQTVGVDVVHTVDTVATHADGGETGGAIDVVVVNLSAVCARYVHYCFCVGEDMKFLVGLTYRGNFWPLFLL